MLVQKLISSSKYDTKCPYTMTPIGICIHNTANDASAQNERDNVNRSNNNDEVSFHIAIDDVEAIQLIPFNRNTWHAGDGANGTGNRKYISVEICYSKSGGTRFINAEKRAAKEVAAILKSKGWTISNVKKHQDFSAKYCPHRTLDMGWQRFLNMISAELNGSGGSTPSTKELYRVRKSWADAASQLGAFENLDSAIALAKKNSGYSVYNSSGTKVYPTSSGSTVSPDPEIKRYTEYGKCTITADAIYFRSKPYVGSDNPIQGQYYKNESVNYDLVVITECYVWISWIGASTSTRRYMPITDRKTGEKWAYCV